MNILQCAIEHENAASARYEELAARATVSDQQSLFSLLAQVEREHRQRLEALQRDLSRHGATATRLDIDRCPQLTLPEAERLDTDGYVDVTRAEEASIAFYEEMAASAENPELRRLCRELAEEEREHLEKIARIYDFVEGPKTYLAWGEFGNLREY